MNKNVSDQEIFIAALGGVNNAFRKYHKWSNGWWGAAPESFIES
jgi:hypothetical protein